MSIAAPVWVTRPQDSFLEEGKPGYLHCLARANPEPEVTWLRNNLFITPEVSQSVSRRISVHVLFKCIPFSFLNSFFPSSQDSRFKLFPNGTLRINSVEVYDGLIYGCKSKTAAGQLVGQARVNVLGEPDPSNAGFCERRGPKPRLGRLVIDGGKTEELQIEFRLQAGECRHMSH